MQAAPDAKQIDTTELSIEDVVEHIATMVEERARTNA
jgi:cytidylate kinase